MVEAIPSKSASILVSDNHPPPLPLFFSFPFLSFFFFTISFSRAFHSLCFICRLESVLLIPSVQCECNGRSNTCYYKNDRPICTACQDNTRGGCFRYTKLLLLTIWLFCEIQKTFYSILFFLLLPRSLFISIKYQTPPQFVMYWPPQGRTCGRCDEGFFGEAGKCEPCLSACNGHSDKCGRSSCRGCRVGGGGGYGNF